MNSPASIDHSSQARPGVQPFPDRLYVVTAISNPARYRSRYNLYRAFEKHIVDSGAILITVEMAFGDRPFEVTEAANPHHVQVRGNHELWHKENLLNIGMSRLPASAKYVAWIDADVSFTRPDWAQETLHQLQHFDVVQLFSEALDLGPNGHVIGQNIGWVESKMRAFPFHGLFTTREFSLPFGAKASALAQSGQYQGQPAASGMGVKVVTWHSGFAWAARREALNKLGGLIDVAILGSADKNMAAGLYGFMEETLSPNFSVGYRDALLGWQKLAERNIRQNVGLVEGTLIHAWHGKKTERGYHARWKILEESQFDPRTDLKKDTQGLWQLEDDGSPRFVLLRDELRQYFRSRNEDSVDA